MAEGRSGFVSLVGAGPGDPGLVTVRGVERVREADLILYDELVPVELLALAPESTLQRNVGKRGHEEPPFSQEEIEHQMVEAARAGMRVVRLKGGDPFVFGRGGEEASACVRAGIDFEIVPGVSSSLAATAYAGMPVTDRRHAASFAVVTGHKDPTAVTEATRWSALARAVDTLVILMGMRNLPDLVERMIAGGVDPRKPSAVVCQGTMPAQRVVEAPLEELPTAASAAGIRPPAAIVIGDVVRLRAELDWFVPGPMAGVQVLVTRAPERSRDFEILLRAVGANPVRVPLVDFAPTRDSTELDAALGDLVHFDEVIFASENAVRFTVERARETGGFEALASRRIEIACVGTATAEAARRAGLHVSCVGAGGGLDLLEEIEKQQPVAGRRFLLPRSEIGRDDLVTGLREKGGEAVAVVAYRTLRPPVDADSLGQRLGDSEFDVASFASPSAVAYFGELLGDGARAALRGVTVTALGETTAAALRDVGIEPDVVPERPELQEWVDTLARHWRDNVLEGD